MSLLDVVSVKVQDWLWGVKEDKLVEQPEMEPERKDSNPQDNEKVQPLKYAIDDSVERRKVMSRDGLELNCLVIPGKSGPENNGKGKVMLLCSPLGFSNIYVFRPIIAKYGTEYTYVNWQYRSLFESDSPNHLRRCSIRDHAEDALDVLKGLGYECANVMVGHSMGVSVSTEFVLLYPQHVENLVMVNGGHGHVFSTAFQPFMRIPFVGNVSEFIVKTLLRNNPKRTMEFLLKVGATKPVETALNLVGKLTATKYMKHVQGEDFFLEWFQMYIGGLAQDDKSAASYCRLFQELHAHSTYHLLNMIENNVLLISGGIDYLTPPYLMKEMAQEMPNAEYHCCTLSTHLTLMENPEFVLDKMDDFLARNAVKQEQLQGKPRCVSMCCHSHNKHQKTIEH